MKVYKVSFKWADYHGEGWLAVVAPNEEVAQKIIVDLLSPHRIVVQEVSVAMAEDDVARKMGEWADITND